MNIGRCSRRVMVVATCLLSIPLTMWVVSRSHSEGIHLKAVGEDVRIDVTPPLTLERWLQALPTAAPDEQSTAWPDSADADSAPPMMIPVAPSAETPPVAPSRTPDVVPPRGPIAAALETRTRGYLQQLEGLEDGAGNLMERVATLFTFLEQQECPGATCRAAQGAIEAYLRTRAGLIRTMLEAFLASDGVYDGAPEQHGLQVLHAAFTTEMATLAAHVPMLAQLPDVLATSLPVPDYLKTPADDTPERQHLSPGDGPGAVPQHADVDVGDMHRKKSL